MTVRELLARIDSRELAEWAAFFQLEPWGAEVEDFRAALVTAAIANAHRDPRRRRQPYKPTDFMPRREPVPEQSQEEIERTLEAWARALEARMGGN